MKKLRNFNRGMGIGGWLTNYKRFNVLPENKRMDITIGDLEHFATYITEEDVKNIKNLGMDHIRVGFDQLVMEEKPFVYREETFSHLDNFIYWCEKYDLGIVLNMHKAIGNYCDIKEEVELLDDEGLQNRFVAMWEYFEKRYHNKGDIIFELLNEVRDVDPDKWNDLAEKTIKALRKLNATRKIIIGPTCWNNCYALKNLRVYDDENVIYTCHFYEPFGFTHQRGVLQPVTLYYNRKMEYPGDIEKYRNFNRISFGNDGFEGADEMNIDWLRTQFKGAADFVKNHPDKILWCGEFGTIRHADIKWRENWMKDIITLIKEQDMPYCVWNYLSTPNDGNRFSLVDDDNRKILSENLAKIIRGDF